MTGADAQNLDLLRSSLKLCPNFPKKGITFIDVFGVFANPKAHRALIDLILSRLKKLGTTIDAVVGLEARGFIFGPQIALELQVPFVPVRKLGKLPGKVAKIDYDLEYGKDTMEIQTQVLKPGTKILLVDDLLATGGTLGAAQKLCVDLGCEVVETLVIIELLGLNGREKLTDVNHFTTLLQFSEADLEEIATNSDRIHESNHA
ncbi:unnamed protein product [Adineta steineri]|uniref:Adenine phosphoribosyltransferase n=1 Tax=Adineta steineri TaxID=433720 RepID=A0A818H3Q6_9BILA|nr:unnamed protein product [Adineta steineri]CAF0945919.1 unnamed protein product [Adineta steineri]CAF3501993.1 unnamed protein product [Adineta steineri]CAF3550186.1 unnamed protein product [Adineta steineri]